MITEERPALPARQQYDARGLAELVRNARSLTAPVTPLDALMAVDADDIGELLHARFADDAVREVIGVGLGASPGAASGRLVLDAAAAIDAADSGTDVILVRPETSPDDVLGMQLSKGIVTARGGLTSHAAVVARGWGVPAVVGVPGLEVGDDGITLGGRFIPAGSMLSIDGRSGEVMLGDLHASAVDIPPELDTLLGWADSVSSGVVTVRANADNPDDATNAFGHGALGIGLCRTEHMFLSADRLPAMRRFILADCADAEAEALAELEIMQVDDFAELLAASAGRPVTIRLLDPPLHEFLPSLDQLLRLEATDSLDDQQRAELTAVRRLREINPMIGTRGVRLGVVRPGVYQMQVRALARAVTRELDRGVAPHVEIMIPLVVSPSEMIAARQWIGEALRELGASRSVMDAVKVGAMVETPRAALVAGEIAEHADFLSFGTNDLTQLAFGFSRDDVETSLMPAYLSSGLLDASPFDELDTVGVGRLVRLACSDARAVRSDIKIGVCGEHAGRAASIAALIEAGVDYVSCSPFRVPTARLAVAQALIRSGRAELSRLPKARVEPEVLAEATAGVVDDTDHDAEGFLVLHALRIKGFATLDIAAELTGLERPGLERRLTQFTEAGLLRHVPARGLWQLTPEGCDLHTLLLRAEVGDAATDLQPHYEEFLELNGRVKQVCADWQIRGGEPNDHSDTAYDQARIAELTDVCDAALPIIDRLATVVARFQSYGPRLSTAATQVADGETKQFTGVMCGSFHDIWMELHEDLIQTIGIDRVAEGSF